MTGTARRGHYPVGDRDRRAAMRAEFYRREMARHEEHARTAGWSLSCRYGHHAPEGCGDDGANCLCWCHDPGAGSGGGP